MSETTRKAFEAHVQSLAPVLNLSLERSPWSGNYINDHVESRWLGWQAALALPDGAAPVLPSDVIEVLADAADFLSCTIGGNAAKRAGMSERIAGILRRSPFASNFGSPDTPPTSNDGAASLSGRTSDGLEAAIQDAILAVADRCGLVCHDLDTIVKAAASAALRAGPQPEPVAWIYEDELPPGYPYDLMFPYSKVDGVRMFPIFGPPQPVAGDPPAGFVLVPVEPSEAHLESMALRYRHDFGLLPHLQKRALIGQMAQLYEEAIGEGFFKLPQPAGARQDNDLTVGRAQSQHDAGGSRSSPATVPSTTEEKP